MRIFNSGLSVLAGITVLSLTTPAYAAKPRLEPLHTRSELKGTLKFYSTDGTPQFKCRVRLILFTDKGGANNLKLPMVKSAIGLNCPQGFFFESLPWQAGGDRDGIAEMFPFGWNIEGGQPCSGDQTFAVDKSGVWTATSGCVTGSLRSDPPITIRK